MKKILILLAAIFLAGCLGQTDVPIYDGDSKLSMQEARQIAEDICGPTTSENFFNKDTRTWWFDLVEEKEMCNPACVVNDDTREAEINYRCMGALPP